MKEILKSTTGQNGRTHLISRDDPAPERDVRPALRGARRTAFGREVLHGSSRWYRVERHVYDGGDTTRRRCARARPEALPVRPPGFVEMDMCARDRDHKRTHARTRAPSDVIESEREVVGGFEEENEKRRVGGVVAF